MTPTWLLDEYMLDSPNSTGDMKQAILQSGANLHVAKYVPFQEKQDYGNFTDKDCVILYGTIGYIQKCKQRFNPGAFGFKSNTACNVYYNHIPNDLLLNSNYFMLPFGHVKSCPEAVFSLIQRDEFFIRPNSGYKTFTGLTVNRTNIHDEMSSSMQLTSVMDETICLISTVKNIKGEYRFVIGNHEVIDGSQYRYNDILDIRHDWPIAAWKLADEVAKLDWQLDTVYTCDIAITDEGPKVIELNSFCSSGLYACDKNLVVEKVNEIALLEFEGEI